MASPEAIAAFRLQIAEPTTDYYTDLLLSSRIDGAASLTILAGDIWYEKAARYAKLVDMQEGTSRRSLSQMYDHALGMAKALSGGDGTVGGTTTRRVQTRAIERA